MKGLIRWIAAGAAALSLAGCVGTHADRMIARNEPLHQARAERMQGPPTPPTPVILISIDGFRADYLDRGVTPTLKALAEGGARSERMLPSFPSLTFPNHYTLVTGLTPDHHGIVNNTFEDPALPGGRFRIASKAAVLDRRSWDGGTPIWVTAEKAGLRTATEFWPGSEADIQGVRPSLYSAFDQNVPSDARVDKVLSWLDLPTPQRPTFLTLYFDVVDTAGHYSGPDSAEVNRQLGVVDAAVARLQAGLKARGIDANLVIVADHGMASTPQNQHVYMDDWPGAGHFRIVTAATVAGLVPESESVAQQLVGTHPHATCYRKAEIPARLRYGSNSRIPPVICIAEVGWVLTTHDRDEREKRPLLGEHGYDPADPSMGALFIANGPQILPHVVLKPISNTDVYGFICRLLGLEPLANDGHPEALYPALR